MQVDFYTVHSCGVNFHVLCDGDGLYLIDAGFLCARRYLQRALVEMGWERKPIRGIVLTHGHFDHIANVTSVVRETEAWVAGPRLDASHYAGRAKYSGWGQVTGWLEAAGRSFFDFQPFVPDRLLDDGDRLDIWHGLRVVHLPGHTAGHSGYYCEKNGYLFTGDLFASYERFSHVPPAIFNVDREGLIASIDTALSLQPSGVIPNHGDGAAPEVHLKRMKALRARSKWSG